MTDAELTDTLGGFAPLNTPLPSYQPPVLRVPGVDLGGGDGSPRHVDN